MAGVCKRTSLPATYYIFSTFLLLLNYANGQQIYVDHVAYSFISKTIGMIAYNSYTSFAEVLSFIAWIILLGVARY
jgi:hypothetical protein